MNNFRHLPLKITISLKSKTANRGQKSVNLFFECRLLFFGKVPGIISLILATLSPRYITVIHSHLLH